MNRKILTYISILFVASVILMGCTSTDVREDEKLLLITIEELADQGIAVGTPSQEGVNYVARRFINGTTEIEYEYDAEKDSANATILLFYSEADTLRNEELAIKAFDDAIEAYFFGASLNNGSIEIVETPNGFTLGEQNYSAVLSNNGSNFGNLVVTRKGTLVYSFILVGPTIRYEQTLNKLLGPKLELYNE